MIEILSTLVSQIIKTIWVDGPIGMLAATAIAGWVISAVLFFKGRSTRTSSPNSLVDIKSLYEKHTTAVNALNEKYNATILSLNEKRIEDIKELNTEYRLLAKDILSTLDRISLILDTGGDHENN